MGQCVQVSMELPARGEPDSTIESHIGRVNLLPSQYDYFKLAIENPVYCVNHPWMFLNGNTTILEYVYFLLN